MTTEAKMWVSTGNEFSQMPAAATIGSMLPLGVYITKEKPITKEIYLERVNETFTFNGKLYGLENKFIQHVLNTFHATTANLGVLLNGAKGTGKTICAKLIANAMGLPIILCDSPFDQLPAFIAKFDVPAVFFFDEFEKSFRNKTEMLLSAMDGAYNTTTRKIFLITTNQLHINENFLSRPSRIRYKKTFGNLPENVVRDYCKDNLKDAKRTDEVVTYIDTLAISTIDILKTLVEELNIHNCSIDEFSHFLNVETAPYVYDITSCGCSNAYTVDEFKRELVIWENNEDVEEETNERDEIEDSKVNSTKPVTALQPGDAFQNGIVTKALDKDGIILIRNSYNYGKPYTMIKIHNIDSKPSLYSVVF